MKQIARLLGVTVEPMVGLVWYHKVARCKPKRKHSKEKESLDVLSRLFAMYGGKMNKIHGSKIQAKIFLYKDMNDQEIYLFLDSSNDDEYFYPRSFVISPELDYSVGQYKYTVLWKEKRNRVTGESEVLTQYKDFVPQDS